mmetsp:Transcript_9964/g.14099  ORF Transcript_9964/g.14099 Transcript_9964/m.14099 type:complete len:147 (+) Transcript_9964:2-442(+)
MKGNPTHQRYKFATVFVDHFSGYVYQFYNPTLTSAETVIAKRALEAHLNSYGVKVQCYHTDNGRFADKAFIEDVESQGQTISMCRVNVHWQNGIVEKMICDLTEGTRKMLLHLQVRWKKAFSPDLWPLAFRKEADRRNFVPRDITG